MLGFMVVKWRWLILAAARIWMSIVSRGARCRRAAGLQPVLQDTQTLSIPGSESSLTVLAPGAQAGFVAVAPGGEWLAAVARPC